MRYPPQGVMPVGTAYITGGTIDGVVIGGTTPAAGTFTTMSANHVILTDGDIAGDAITLAQAKNGCIIFNDSGGAVDWDLPAAEAGLSVRVKSLSAHAIVLDPDDSDVIHLIDGTALAAGNAIDLAAAAGNYVWLVAYDDVDWWIMAQVGAIADGGAD